MVAVVGTSQSSFFEPMAMMRSLLVLFLVVGLWRPVHAEVVVVRDSIGPDSSATDGMGGGSTAHNGAIWTSPGMVFNMPQDGYVSQAKFVIFAVDQTLSQPENDLADILGYPMNVHIWTDGALGGADSFGQNPQLDLSTPGHIYSEVNSQTQSFITVQAFGETGPVGDPDLFTTFLVTVDLSSFDIQLQGGEEYVMGLIHNNAVNFITGGGTYRVSGSTFTGFEDVYMESIQVGTIPPPGYLVSQHGFSFEQYAGSLSIENGDHDVSQVINGNDFFEWQKGNSAKPLSAFDLNAWVLNYGEDFTVAAATATVPEPSSLLLTILGAILASGNCRRR